jgi:hypothetical protein
MPRTNSANAPVTWKNMRLAGVVVSIARWCKDQCQFVFCMTAISWAWSVAEIADRLIEESTEQQFLFCLTEGFAAFARGVTPARVAPHLTSLS